VIQNLNYDEKERKKKKKKITFKPKMTHKDEFWYFVFYNLI